MPYYETGDTATVYTTRRSNKIHFKLQFSTLMETVEHGSCHEARQIFSYKIIIFKLPVLQIQHSSAASRVNKSDPRCSGECFG